MTSITFKISSIPISSYILSLLTPLISLVSVWTSVAKYSCKTTIIWNIITCLTGFLAFVLGIITILIIRKKHINLREENFAIAGMIISILFPITVIAVCGPEVLLYLFNPN